MEEKQSVWTRVGFLIIAKKGQRKIGKRVGESQSLYDPFWVNV